MPLGGVPAKPTALRKLEGDLSKGKAPSMKNRNEPMPKPSDGQPPSWLRKHKEALKIWKAQAPEYQRLGLLTVADIESFAHFCYFQAEWHRLDEEIREDGEIMTHANGQLSANPKCKLRQQIWKNLVELGRSFGWTPSARTRIEAQPAENNDDNGILGFVRKRA